MENPRQTERKGPFSIPLVPTILHCEHPHVTSLWLMRSNPIRTSEDPRLALVRTPSTLLRPACSTRPPLPDACVAPFPCLRSCESRTIIPAFTCPALIINLAPPTPYIYSSPPFSPHCLITGGPLTDRLEASYTSGPKTSWLMF